MSAITVNTSVWFNDVDSYTRFYNEPTIPSYDGFYMTYNKLANMRVHGKAIPDCFGNLVFVDEPEFILLGK